MRLGEERVSTAVLFEQLELFFDDMPVRTASPPSRGQALSPHSVSLLLYLYVVW